MQFQKMKFAKTIGLNNTNKNSETIHVQYKKEESK